MKKKLLIFLLLTACVSVGYSQIVTPFTPAGRDDNGKRIYVKPQENYRRTSLSIGYGGYGSVTMRNWYSNKNAKSVNGGNNLIDCRLTSLIGTFSLSIGYEVNPWLEIEFPFMVALSQGEFKGTNYSVAKYNDYWYMFMPGMRINWMRNNWLALYSKANIGMTLHRRDESRGRGSTTANDKGGIAWQLSPAGIEIGTGCVNFFVEGGYGYRGFAFAGIKFKLGDGGGGGSSSQWERIVYPPK